MARRVYIAQLRPWFVFVGCSFVCLFSPARSPSVASLRCINQLIPCIRPQRIAQLSPAHRKIGSNHSCDGSLFFNSHDVFFLPPLMLLWMRLRSISNKQSFRWLRMMLVTWHIVIREYFSFSLEQFPNKSWTWCMTLPPPLALHLPSKLRTVEM